MMDILNGLRNTKDTIVELSMVKQQLGQSSHVLRMCVNVLDADCHSLPCAVKVGNAIGKGNRHYFITFLWLELYGMLSGC